MSKIIDKHKRLDGFQQLFLLLVICLIIVLSWIFITTPASTTVLTSEVARFQDRSGVESPVTAVLLNFRGYDTLLEVVVLLLSVIGAWSMAKASLPSKMEDENPVLMGAVRILAPLMCLIAAYLVWQGSHLAGGAFQGGAILGAAGVLLLVAELPWLRTIPALPIRVGLVIGPLLFLGVALLCLFLTGDLLGYPEKTAGGFTLLIEAVCALSIGLTLASLFAGGRAEEKHQHRPSPSHPSTREEPS